MQQLVTRAAGRERGSCSRAKSCRKLEDVRGQIGRSFKGWLLALLKCEGDGEEVGQDLFAERRCDGLEGRTQEVSLFRSSLPEDR